MANIDDGFSVDILVLGDSDDDQVLIAEGGFDPSSGAGYEAPIGSLFLRFDSPTLYLKTGAPDTGWSTVTAGGTDELVKTSSGDGAAGFLADKLVDGLGMTYTESTGANRTLTIDFTDITRPQTVYVAKGGNDSSDGLAPTRAKLTFGAAMTAAAGLTPSTSNRISVECEDGGTYTEDFTVPEWVFVNAPNATIEGAITIGDNTELDIHEVTKTGTGNAVTKTGTGVSYVRAEILRATGAANAVENTAATSILITHVRQTFVENGTGYLDSSTGIGHIHLDCEDIYVTGTGTCVDRASNTGAVQGRVSHMLDIGAGVGTGISIMNGKVDLNVGTIENATAFSVNGTGELNMFVNEIDPASARVQTSGTARVNVIESSTLRWRTTSNNFTARRVDFVALDTTGGSFTMNLPSPPSDGDNVSFQDSRGSFEDNPLTVDAGAGNLIDDGGAGSQTVLLDVSGTSGVFIYNGALGRWTFTRIQEEVAFSPANLIYVTKNGDDTIGDGSFSNPFLTIKRGVTEAQTRVASSPIPTTVKVLDGIYDEINPIDMTFANSELVQVQGEQDFAIIVRPTVDNQPIFDMTSSVADAGPTLNRFTIHAANLPAFKTNNQAAVRVSGPGRFVVDRVNISDVGIGIDSGNGVSADQETVYDFATIANSTTAVEAKGSGVMAMQVAFFRDNDTAIRAQDTVRVEIGNYSTQGANPGDPTFGVGFDIQDSATVIATSGTISNHATGVIAQNLSQNTFLTTAFSNNDVEFNQVDGTSRIGIQGTLSKTKQLIADGANVTLNYIDTDTADFIVGNADSTGDPGKEFRVRDIDGRVAIGDNATDENIATGTIGGSRSLNLIDENGNFRIWRFTTADGEDPAIEWVKGVNPALPDSVGDTPIVSITGGTNVITIDVSGTDYNGPFETPYGINRETLAERAFPAGREIRVNGSAVGSNDADYTVASAVYNSGPQTIDITVNEAVTTAGVGGEVVWGGGAGRPDGVSTYVGDPGAAVAAGVGNIRWDMFMQEDDYFVIRRRTSGGGSVPNEKMRLYQDRVEFIGSTTHTDSDSAEILFLQTVAGADNYLQINNSIVGEGPEIVAVGDDANIDIEMIPKGTGTVVVPAGYEANIVANSLITKQYIDDNLSIQDLASVTVGLTASSAIPTTWANISWPLTHVENNTGVIEHDNTNTDRVLIKEDGLYFIAFSMSFDADAGEETIEARVLIDDTTVVPGSLRQASEDDEINDLSNTITAELTAGTYLTFQTQASGTGNLIDSTTSFMVTRAGAVKGDTGPPGTGATVEVRDEGISLGTTFSSLNFIGLQVTASVGSPTTEVDITVPGRQHLSRHNGGIVQTFTTTPTTINFATSSRNDAAFAHAVVAGGSEITINQTGWYEITYGVSLDSPTGGSRTSSQTELQLNGTLVPGTRSYGYHRTSSAAENTSNVTTKLNLTAGDVIRVQSVRIAGTDGLVTIADGCRLNIQSIDGP